MKKIIALFVALLVGALLLAAVSAADVYVNDYGTGDGSSAASPLGNMTAAIERVASGGTVHIVATYTCADEYYEPAHTGDIVIEGGKYIFTNGKFNRWFLSGSGSTTFQNITFEYGQGTTSLFIAQYNKLILGEGLSFPTTGKCYVVGGFQYAQPDGNTFDLTKDSDVTVKSGNIWCVCGFGRGANTDQYTGTSHIRIEGGEIATVYGAAVNGSYAGNGVIDVVGGKIGNVRAAGDETRRINNCEINISGGTIDKLTVNNVLGQCVVNFTGGTVGGAEKTVADKVQEFVTDGKAILNYSANVDAKRIALYFDESNLIAGGTPAASDQTVVKLTIGQTTAYVNGEAKTLDVAPVIENGRTLMPLRFIAEAMGATVAWDGTTGTATLTAGDNVVVITLGSTTATVGGVAKTLDVPAASRNGRTLLPVRFIAESFGAEVAWDGATSTATLTK